MRNEAEPDKAKKPFADQFILSGALKELKFLFVIKNVKVVFERDVQIYFETFCICSGDNMGCSKSYMVYDAGNSWRPIHE
jgi:hypothetical protein